MSVKAYVTKDGKVINKKKLQKYALKQESKQIPDDNFSSDYDKVGVKKPPYSLEILSMLPELSTWHYRACVAKSMDIVGHGHNLVPREGVEHPKEGQLEVWDEFVERCEKNGETIDEIFYQWVYNHETIGNGSLEVIRELDPEGPIHSVKNIPNQTVRRLSEKEIPLKNNESKSVNRIKIYVQKRGNRKVYFKEAGAKFDLDFKTGVPYELGSLPIDRRANELLYVKNYTNRSDYYGLPDIMPALPAILGDREAQMYNVDFFENHGVPDYAVTVTGADLDQETENIIHDYFQNKVKESHRSTLVLTANKENRGMSGDSNPIDIKFEKLGTEIKDGSFKLYRQDNRDEILSANGVPPYRASIAVVGSLGGDLAKDMDEIYKENIIDFRQTVFEQRIQSFILDPLEITDYKLEFEEFDTTNDEKEDSRHEKFFNLGSLTPNELREYQGKEIIDEPGMNSYYLNGKVIAGPEKENQNHEDDIITAMNDLRNKLIEVVAKNDGSH